MDSTNPPAKLFRAGSDEARSTRARTLSSSTSKIPSPVPVVDKVAEEDHRMLLADELESITLPDMTTQALGPAARDTFAIFEDLCLLGNGERPQFLQFEYLHKTFTLELMESVLTNYHELFRKVCCLSSPSPIRDLYAGSCLSCSQHSQLFNLITTPPFPPLLKT
jgi:hypothetical protein